MKIYTLIVLILICSCKSSESNFKPIIGDGTVNNPIDINNNCNDAAYADWQTSDYVLPFPTGLSYPIGLSNCGSSYHAEGQPDQFATDFNMPIGATIQCSRAGTIVFVEESGTDYQFPNNKIIVDHGDNTFGQYMHLTKNGALVTVGQNVVQGTNLGISGATGLAGYPHLHFVITINSWGYPYDSTPVNFSNTSPNPTGLVQGEIYSALSY